MDEVCDFPKTRDGFPPYLDPYGPENKNPNPLRWKMGSDSCSESDLCATGKFFIKKNFGGVIHYLHSIVPIPDADPRMDWNHRFTVNWVKGVNGALVFRTVKQCDDFIFAHDCELASDYAGWIVWIS